MKYFKLIVVMMLLVALVGTVALGAGSTKKTRNIQTSLIPVGDLQRELDQTTASSVQVKNAKDEWVEREAGSTYFFQPKAVQKSLDAPIAAGSYNVGTGGTWTSLNAAAFALNTRGIAGPVTLLLTNTTYTEAGFYLAPIVGSDNVNTVTFKPAPTKTVTVNLTNNSTYGGGWTFAGTSNVIIDGSNAVSGTTRDLTIQFDPAQAYSGIGSFNAVINLTPGTDSLTIKNCVIKSMLDPAGAGGRYNITVQGDATLSASYITVDNNEMTQSARNIVIYTNVSSSGPVTANMGRYWNITNNYIHDVLDYGMYLSLIYNCNVSGNTITNVRTLSTEGSTRTSGIYMGGFYNTIKNNKISNVLNQKAAAGSSSNRAFGIYSRFPADFSAAVLGGTPDAYLLNWAGYSTRNRFIQNTIAEVRSNVSSYMGQIGIGTFAGRYDSLFSNTISFEAPTQTGGSVGIYFYGSQLHTFRLLSNNNIVSMNRNNANLAVALRCFDIAGNDYRSPSNNNVYYHPYDDAMEVNATRFTSVANIFTSYGRATDENSLEGNPYLVSATNLHIDGTQPSSADNTGSAAKLRDANDLDLVARDVTPDIGAYEGTSTGTQHDVGVVSLDSPGASGAPDGLPFGPIDITMHNYTQNAEAGLTVNVDIYAPDGSTLDASFSTTASFAAFEFATASFAGPWTPAHGPGGYTFKCKVTVAGDVNTANDELDVVIPVAGMKTIPYTTGFETSGDQDGWYGSGDWALGETSGGNTKLGGAHGGDICYVTAPGAAGTHYTTGGHAFDLYSPYFDFTTTTEAYLSFYHSIQTEMEWDRSIMEYSLDTGKTWTKLGALNEPSPAVNWYSSAVYKNAAGANGTNCFDEVSAGNIGRLEFGDPGFWTSNGDCLNDASPSGPDGYIFVQIKLPATVYGKSYVRFRYSAFSDAGTAFDGWAFDDFKIDVAPEIFTPKTVMGQVVVDEDGSRTNNAGDTPMAGATVDVKYFGVHMAFVTASPSGDYSYDMALPGDYTFWAQPAGYITDFPAVGYQSAKYTDVTITGKDICNYQGSISGKVFHDADNSGGFTTGELGMAGYTVELHKDSVKGALALYGSTVTDANGDYSFNVQPYAGTYAVKMIAQATARQTYPAVPGTWTGLSVSGASNGTHLTGKDFGNWVYAILTDECSVDWFGTGLSPRGYDHNFLPIGTPTLNFEVYKNGSLIATDALSNGIAYINHEGLDLGTYKFKKVSATPAGWVYTYPAPADSVEIVVDRGGIVDSATFMYFKYPTVSGVKYNDLNGNGAKDAGEPGLAGWTINVTGTVIGSSTAVTGPDGSYSFTVGSGSHAVTEVGQTGWTQTSSTPAPFVANSGSTTASNKVFNFGNFQLVTISGTVYRERDNFGVRDGNEEGLSGWDVTLTKGTTVLHQTSGSDGSYSFADVGPGTFDLTQTAIAGWETKNPVSGSYSITTSSGTNVGSQLFGNYNTHDGTKYRTFTYEQLRAADQAKAKKAPGNKQTATSPWYAPTTGNLIAKIYSELGTFQVGKAGSIAPNGKPFAYLLPAKQGDVFKTFNNGKGVFHSGTVNRGFDYDAKGGSMYKAWKSMPADKKNDPLVAQLLTLQVNLEASDKEHTPKGLGALVYNWPNGGMWTGNKSIDDIAAYADDRMTNWGGVSYWEYDSLYNIVKRINEAFASTSITDTTALGGWRAVPQKFIWQAYKTPAETPFLLAMPGAISKQRPVGQPEPIVESYALNQNYPNPFNPSTTLSFDLPEASIVTLKIYNILGQEVATVLDRVDYESGQQEVDFDASGLSSGVYLYRIVAEQSGDQGQSFTQVKKMVLMK